MRRSRDRAGECPCEQPVEEFARSAQLFNPSEWVHYIASTALYGKRLLCDLWGLSKYLKFTAELLPPNRRFGRQAECLDETAERLPNCFSRQSRNSPSIASRCRGFRAIDLWGSTHGCKKSH